MDIQYYEGKNGHKFKRDSVQKKVFEKEGKKEKEIISTNPSYKDARVYGSENTQEEYQAD
jgi:hypothetical protein